MKARLLFVVIMPLVAMLIAIAALTLTTGRVAGFAPPDAAWWIIMGFILWGPPAIAVAILSGPERPHSPVSLAKPAATYAAYYAVIGGVILALVMLRRLPVAYLIVRAPLFLIGLPVCAAIASVISAGILRVLRFS